MDVSNFINDRMKLSPYNYSENVRKTLGIRPQEKITVVDATLREGAQGSIVGFSIGEKLDILQKSYDAGVRYFQIGTTREEEDLKAIMRYIHEHHLDVTTEILFAVSDLDFKPAIDKFIEMGIDVFDIMGFYTEYGAASIGGEENIPKMIQFQTAQVAYIVSKGKKASFDPMDAPRMEMDTMMDAYRAAVSAGANQIRVLDTVGTGSPATWRYLVSTLRKEFPDIDICVHCHNDFGQAMANVYVSLECGANAVDATINGLGERCGNAHLAQVAAGAELMYGISTGIDLSKMTELSRYVGDIVNHHVDRNTPIVGDWAFAHADEGHYQILAVAPWAFEGIHADVFGNHQDTLIGPMAGPVSTRSKLAAVGITDISDEQVLQAYKLVAEEVHARKAVMGDEELKEFVEKNVLGA